MSLRLKNNRTGSQLQNGPVNQQYLNLVFNEDGRTARFEPRMRMGMRSRRSGKNSNKSHSNNPYGTNNNNNSPEPIKKPVDPQVFSSPWTLYSKKSVNLPDIYYWICFSQPNTGGGLGSEIRHIIYGIYDNSDDKLYMNIEHLPCRYKRYNIISTLTKNLRKNNFKHLGHYVIDKFSMTMSEFMNSNEEFNPLENMISSNFSLSKNNKTSGEKNLFKTFYKWIKINKYAIKLPFKNKYNENNNKNKLGFITRCIKINDCGELDCPWAYWGTGLYRLTNDGGVLNQDDFEQEYPYPGKEIIKFKRGYKLKNSNNSLSKHLSKEELRKKRLARFNKTGGSQFIHIPNFGRRKIRYQKNGRAYVIVNKKKLKL